VRFGHEGTHPHVDAGLAAVQLAPLGQHRLAQVGDGLHVVERLLRVADHEIELDRAPAARVNLARGVDHLLVRHGLVDDVAHLLGGCFRSQGEAAPLAVLQGIQ